MMKFFAWLVMFSLAAGFSLGAVAGDVEDCQNYYSAKDYKRAFPVCSRAAKQGDVFAQFGLGGMYANGEGVPKNDREAVKWLRLAAEQGDAKAQFNLGV
ncbi:MAG: tetratricopeptide repeat protein, partial [Gammaproteobacteria bacterium]